MSDSDIFDPPDPPRVSGEPPDGGAAARSRFEACRWRATQDQGGAAYCTHRDVLPYAGMNGFNPQAWCPDCAFFKMRRGTRKQSGYHPDDY